MNEQIDNAAVKFLNSVMMATTVHFVAALKINFLSTQLSCGNIDSGVKS